MSAATRGLGRLVPRRLGGQLALLLLAAILVAQTATVVWLGLGRRQAVEDAAREQILGRTAALVRLVEDLPVDVRGRILEASTTSRVRYTVGPEPSVGPDATRPPDDDIITDAVIEEAFGPGREVRAEMQDLPRRLNRNRHDDDDDDRGWRQARMRIPAVAVSARLSDGTWLNAETLLPRPALWALPTLVSTLALAAATLVVVLFTVRRITRPLSQLADAADRLGRGETVPMLAESGPEEVRRTTRAFNAMQDRVNRFVSDRTRMLAAISHDLRTPLTTLRLRAEFVDDPEIRDKIVETVEEMSRMTEATLAFAREDAAEEESHLTDLSALVRAVADDFQDLGHPISVDGPERLDLTIRPVALRRALRNLVENAVRYGGTARLRLRETPAEVAIAVEDEGPGIPADKLAEVFEPFVRLETSRNQETGGVGLGLAIARTIVRAHGGELTLANRPGGGLVATIVLPRARG